MPRKQSFCLFDNAKYPSNLKSSIHAGVRVQKHAQASVRAPRSDIKYAFPPSLYFDLEGENLSREGTIIREMVRSPYWINGKAGSGKSALMRFVYRTMYAAGFTASLSRASEFGCDFGWPRARGGCLDELTPIRYMPMKYMTWFTPMRCISVIQTYQIHAYEMHVHKVHSMRHPSMRCMLVRCIPVRCTLVRCRPVRYTPMR
jgi:hypothetical protein